MVNELGPGRANVESSAPDDRDRSQERFAMEAGYSQSDPAVPPEARETSQSPPHTPAADVAMIRVAPSLQSPHVINIGDLRRRARRRLPRVVFNYVDGGAD